MEIAIIGPGRAGRSLERALRRVGSVEATLVDRHRPVGDLAQDADLVVIATPDRAVADVARSIRPGRAVVAHLAGSLGLAALAPHRRTAALHPLVSLPDASVGAERLAAGAWFAVAGDPLVDDVVTALGGRSFTVADDDRGLYHAAAVIASNHLVALFGQVERLAIRVDVPFEAFVELGAATLDNVGVLGPRAALTGPVARGDEQTLDRHRRSLGASEQATYDAMVREARKLLS